MVPCGKGILSSGGTLVNPLPSLPWEHSKRIPEPILETALLSSGSLGLGLNSELGSPGNLAPPGPPLGSTGSTGKEGRISWEPTRYAPNPILMASGLCSRRAAHLCPCQLASPCPHALDLDCPQACWGSMCSSSLSMGAVVGQPSGPRAHRKAKATGPGQGQLPV